MKTNANETEGRISDHGEGLGTITEEMVRRRAGEIAVINGRGKNHVLDTDLEQARRELQGEERLDTIPTSAESLPESKRWDPVPGSPGYKAPTVSAPDEQTFAERLVEEGVADAEHDQQVQATRESLRREKQS
jgi:hypothetical protein